MNPKLLAQITNPVIDTELGTGDVSQGSVIVGGLVGALTGGLFIFAFILALLYLILGGFDWITTGGDKGKLEVARNKITHAIIGLIIVASIWAIMTLIGNFFGITFPEIELPTLPSLIGP